MGSFYLFFFITVNIVDIIIIIKQRDLFLI